MFRMLRLKPPNGWNAVAWELGIVTLGVFIALAVQQWEEGRDWEQRVDASRAAIRSEVADHYNWSVEWRVVSPCILAQLDTLERRVEASGAALDPAPTFRGTGGRYVLRMPAKEYATSVWSAAQSNGVSSRLDPDLHNELSQYYEQLRLLVGHVEQNGIDSRRLIILSRPIPLDPMTRYSMLQTLAELRGRVEFVDLLSGQVIERIVSIDMVPPADVTKQQVERFGTYRFCRSQDLPMRSLAEASRPLAN